MIVGATSTPDQIILQTASQLYQTHSLRRVYYSAYSPIPHADAQLPGKSPPLLFMQPYHAGRILGSAFLISAGPGGTRVFLNLFPTSLKVGMKQDIPIVLETETVLQRWPVSIPGLFGDKTRQFQPR